jgi:hypothetical protein
MSRPLRKGLGWLCGITRASRWNMGPEFSSSILQSATLCGIVGSVLCCSDIIDKAG